jgi:hypothetical protein
MKANLPIKATSADVDNVVDFPKSTTTSAFGKLTVKLILDQHGRGVLEETVLLALLAGRGTAAMKSRFILQGANGAPEILQLAGRQEWALSHLLAAGATGCTPIGHPGPRWSDYVFKLRRRSLDIATLTEHHDGPFAGTHGRYILLSKVERLTDLQVAS